MANPNIWAPGTSLVTAGSLRTQAFTATEGQTVFTLTNFTYGLGVEALYVFVSGLIQRIGVDFTETSSTSFTLSAGVPAGTIVFVVGFVGIASGQEYATAAAESADDAATSATNAATSATEAATSATAAATSATSASNSATTATTQATSATNSAATATTQASNAATSATSASNSATSATSSATSATNSATSAASSATTATTQAANATTQATNAATFVIAAGTSAAAASTSATNAAASATSAANSYDAFDDRYLGSKASAPTLDNDGNALLTGALYWNTTVNQLYIWTGAAWNDAAFNVSGAVTSFSAGSTGFTPATATRGAVTLGGTLAVANGGTGATTASGARTNLGVTPGMDVAGTDIASAATINLSTATGNLVRITGTTTTTAVTINNGQRIVCYAVGAWPLTYHATNMPLPGSANYTCAAGDILIFSKDGSGVIHIEIIKRDGTALIDNSILTSKIDKSAAYTVVAADRGKVINATTGTWTLSLTAAATLGDGFVFAVQNSGSGTITIDPNASETIDGATSVAVAPNYMKLVYCDGSKFSSVGKDPVPVPTQTVKQIVTTTIPAATGTTGIPDDSTSPLSTEGTQIATLNITPAAAANKVKVSGCFTFNVHFGSDIPTLTGIFSVFRGATLIGSGRISIYNSVTAVATSISHVVSFDFLDSPASTSQQTYSVRVGRANVTGTWYVNRSDASATALGSSMAKSLFTLMEI